ncbi:MAG: hypothetical protein K2X28_03615 [Alphaproteobacteria bacterium]|nr:hypothetical protein [Alphaproteobacteria bacterium]
MSKPEHEDTCFYAQKPLPAADDPYQATPMELSVDLLNHIFYGANKEENISFYEGGLIDSDGKPRKSDMRKMGEFVIDYKVSLGYGDKGAVFLAQHVPSRVFVAVKSIFPDSEPMKYADVLSLQKLNRLYGVFNGLDLLKRERTHIFMPLANGIPSTKLEWSPSFTVKATIEDGILKISNLDISRRLIQNFIKEVEYFARSGYLQIDQHIDHVYVCPELQSVYIIDYDGTQYEHPIEERNWGISPFRASIINFLGIHQWGVFESSQLLPLDKLSQLQGPQPMIKFLQSIDNNKSGGYSLFQLKSDFQTFLSEMSTPDIY